MSAEMNYRHLPLVWSNETAINNSNTDVLLLVEGQFFSAHRSVLKVNSGYFKSLLETDEEPSAGHPTRPLNLPGLPSAAFTLLLDFMYSGRLELTMFNIYHVLLCAQFLHMPEAIELCRFFLLQEQQRQIYMGIRPRTENLDEFVPQSNPSQNFTFSSFFPCNFLSLQSTNKDQQVVRPIPQKFTIIPAKEPLINRENCSENCAASENSNKQITLKTSTEGNFNNNSEMYFNCKQQMMEPSLENSDSNQVEEPTETDTNSAVQKINRLKSSVLSSIDAPNLTLGENQQHLSASYFNLRSEQKMALINKMSKSTTIIDIACCDGPVHFQRVINENYKLKTVCLDVDTNDTEDSTLKTHNNNKNNLNTLCTLRHHFESNSNSEQDQEASKNDGQTKSTSITNCSDFSNQSRTFEIVSSTSESFSSENNLKLHCVEVNKEQSSDCSDASDWDNSHHKSERSHHENETLHSLQDKSNSYDKPEKKLQTHSSSYICSNKSTITSSIMLSMPSPLEVSSSFKCFYCKHSFKSRYCFQKHKRRHINPVSYDEKTTNDPTKEFQPLDRNVPFYPCKRCGSKFPSYYFVHKHRKNCYLQNSEH